MVILPQQHFILMHIPLCIDGFIYIYIYIYIYISLHQFLQSYTFLLLQVWEMVSSKNM